MDVHHFVIHHIQKDKHRESSVQLKTSEALLHDDAGTLTRQGTLIQDFVENASTMFDKQRSGKVYADIGREANTFAESLDRYLNEEITFLEFSTRIAQELTKTMKNVTLATGGYMAIADFTASPRKLLVLMIRQEEGFAVDPNTLELRQSIHLDLNTINVGARIDLNAYQSLEERHLSLVKGLKEIAKYFREFIGVENFKSAKDETEELKTVLDAYLHENRHRYDSDKISEIKRNVANLIVENRDSDTALMTIAALVNPAAPEEFHSYANNLGISAELKGDPTAVKNWLRIRYTNKRLTIDFDKGLLQESIHWYPSNDQLVIKVSDFPSLSTKLDQAEE